MHFLNVAANVRMLLPCELGDLTRDHEQKRLPDDPSPTVRGIPPLMKKDKLLVKYSEKAGTSSARTLR